MLPFSALFEPKGSWLGSAVSHLQRDLGTCTSLSAGEACVGSYMGCSALGCPQAEVDAKHNVRTELPSKPAVGRMQIPPWGLPPSTSSYKQESWANPLLFALGHF